MFKKILLPTLVISGTLFGSYCMFLATQGQKSVDIKLGYDRVVYSPLRDVLSPTVGAIFSLGLGAASGLVIGWRQSVRKSNELENRLSNLQKLISEKESEIEAIKLSPFNPALSQLSWFLEEEQSASPTDAYPTNPYPGNTQRACISSEQVASTYANTEEDTIPVKPTWTQMPTTVAEPLVMDSPILQPQLRKVNKLQVKTAVSGFPSAQSVLGLTHKKDISPNMR
jgi:hypothetical protein